MATWEDVREVAARLPEVEEGTLYRRPALRVRKKAFAWLSPHAPRALVLRCDPDERPLMIEARPDVFWTSPHYAGYPMVLVNLETIDRRELADRLEDSWAIAAPQLAPPAGGERR